MSLPCHSRQYKKISESWMWPCPSLPAPWLKRQMMRPMSSTHHPKEREVKVNMITIPALPYAWEREELGKFAPHTNSKRGKWRWHCPICHSAFEMESSVVTDSWKYGIHTLYASHCILVILWSTCQIVQKLHVVMLAVVGFGGLSMVVS